MSNRLDGAKISDIIQLATTEIINNTEKFIESIDKNPTGTDTTSIMVNGVEIALSQAHYALLKAQNNVINQKMKADIKSLTAKFKKSFKK